MLQLNFSPFPKLTTERLVLRKVEESDADEIFFLRSDKTVLQYLDKEPAASKDEALQWIKMIQESQNNGDVILWGITLKGEQKIIGTITFWNISKQHYRAETGYVLHPDHQRKGIMLEAMEAVLHYGFTKMKLHSVAANVNPGNTSSIKLLEKNNFIREAYFKEDYFFNGTFGDSAIYSLLTPFKDDTVTAPF